MDRNECYIVGIGASAGGMGAIFDFFSNVPHDPDVAFVIIRHLKRDHKTQLSKLLEKYTRLRIVDVEKNEVVVPNAIYIMQETQSLIIRNRILTLVDRPFNDVINNSVNEFFISMAQDVKEKAVGIVLSGNLSDGALGALK